MKAAILLLLIASATARAGVERFAVVIGHNDGAADEQRLQYAERDAMRVADTLGELASVPDENRMVLRGPTADRVQSALTTMNARLKDRRDAGKEVVLFVYYSGHGDADALHLGSTRLPLATLESLVRGSPATLRILIIDSCRSGAVTKVKGGRPAPPLALTAADALPGEGMIVMTASTQGEDAQESDQLGGSLFTHYLVSGMRGAADTDGNSIVTLAEALAYTRDQTILASSRTFATQHPTYRFDLRGRAELTLAELKDPQRGRLVLPPGATWLVLHDGGVIGEIGVEGTARSLAVRAGAYTLQGRTTDALLDGKVTVAAGKDTVVATAALARTTYARLVRKGRGQILGGVSGPIAGAIGVNRLVLVDEVIPGAMVGWAWARPSLTVSARGQFARGGELELRHYEVGARISRVWELGHVAVDIGAVADVFDSSSLEVIGPGRSHTVGFDLGPTAAVTVPLPGRLYLGAEATFKGLLGRLESADDPDPSLEGGALAEATLYFGLWL